MLDFMTIHNDSGAVVREDDEGETVGLEVVGDVVNDKHKEGEILGTNIFSDVTYLNMFTRDTGKGRGKSGLGRGQQGFVGSSARGMARLPKK